MCASGNVSLKRGLVFIEAVQLQAGYKNLKNVTGGFMAWEASNLPIEK